jgi:hypothetical protein
MRSSTAAPAVCLRHKKPHHPVTISVYTKHSETSKDSKCSIRWVAHPILRVSAVGTRWHTIDVEYLLIIQATVNPEGDTSCCSATQPTGWATLLRN